MAGTEQHRDFAKRMKEGVSKRVDADDFLPEFGKISGKSAEEKAEWLLSQLTLAEKIELLSGIDIMTIKSIPRLGLPRVFCSDATSGLRNFGPGTSFPSAVALAATWDKKLVSEVGAAIGDECRAVGVSILLGPGVNINRTPVCGRNFEYFGEDPYLTGELAVAYINGAQSRGVAATVKHFACNNSEYDPQSIL